MKMKPILAALALLSGLTSTFAQLTIPSDGTDGPLNLPSTPTSVEIDLSQAITGTWSDNNSANVGKGIYDAQKWAVVFKYSSVNIPAGVSVTFKNHPTYAPVVWLVQGSATIAGTVNINGKAGLPLGPSSVFLPEPGPGGYRGGAFRTGEFGAGLGPGGGYNSPGLYSSLYGNPSILPLIGGSGAGAAAGGGSSPLGSGGGGGGALLIAASNTILVTGNLTALGGGSVSYADGSGGAIKLIADSVTGTGTINAAATGRVRIEANTFSASVITTPSTIRVAPGTTPTIFQANTSRTVRIASVDGLNSPADPTAPLVSSADIAIQKNTPVTIVLETRNFATAGAVVAVRVANKFGGATSLNATLDGGGTSTLSTWRVNTTLAPGFVTLQARATAP